jgi:hypothetical protein
LTHYNSNPSPDREGGVVQERHYGSTFSLIFRNVTS